MKFFILILFVSIFKGNLYSQTENPDSLKSLRQLGLNPNLNEKLLYSFDELSFYNDLHNSQNYFHVNYDPNTQWLWTSITLSNSTHYTSNNSFNFNNMLTAQYQKYTEDSKVNPFTYALGMAQLGAVGYLAYKHFKKYGFK